MEKLKALMDSDPGASAVIITHAVKPAENGTGSISLITASLLSSAEALADGTGGDSVTGCPYPPGCPDDPPPGQ